MLKKLDAHVYVCLLARVMIYAFMEKQMRKSGRYFSIL